MGKKKGKKRKMKIYRSPPDYTKCRLTLVSNLVCNGTGVAAIIRCRSLRNAYKPQSGSADPATTLTNSQYMKNLWDEYRVDKVIVKFTPNANFNIYQDAASTALFVPGLVVSFDRDNSVKTNPRACLSLKGSKQKSLMRSWTYSKTMPKFTGNISSTRGYLNCQADGLNQNETGIITINSLAAFSPAPPAGFNLGYLTLHYDVSFKGRSDSSLTP